MSQLFSAIKKTYLQVKPYNSKIIRRLTVEKLWIWIVDAKLDSILSKWINDITNYLTEKVF